MIYLDDNADAAVLPQALQAYLEASERFGNPSSRHRLGGEAAALFAAARDRIATALGVAPSEIVLTSGGTEANGLALLGSLPTAPSDSPPHVVSSTIEHPSVARTLDALTSRGAITLTRVTPGRDGRLAVEDLEAALRPSTRLVSIVWACNETGVLQPVEDLAALCAARGVLFHTDAVQLSGRLPVDLGALGIGLASFAGHKAGAVGGIGALAGPAVRDLRSVVTGGGQEGGHRAGTENVAGAVSFAVALEHTPSAPEREALAERRDRLEARLALALDGVEILGKSVPRLAGTSCIRFSGCEADGLLMALDVDGVCVSTGSACSSGAIEPSPILLGMGLGADEARQTLRVSLGREASDADIETLVERLKTLVDRMRLAAS